MKGNKAFVNEFDLGHEFISKLQTECNSTIENLNYGDLSFFTRQLLTSIEVDNLLTEINKQNWIPVGIDGIKSKYRHGDKIGSYRLSCYEENLALIMWGRIKTFLPKVRVMKDDSPTDWDEHYQWEPIGVNPLFRFIRYTSNGLLIPHYDGPLIKDENVRSLSSVVIYLSDNTEGGCTRFIKDSQLKLPLNQRNYSDWLREASDDEVVFKVLPLKGGALVFDHRILHDSEKMAKGELKTIIRTDIMYRRLV